VWHERNGSPGLATDFLDGFGERLARNPRDDESCRRSGKSSPDTLADPRWPHRFAVGVAALRQFLIC
jgi:hypothetical protein